MKIKLKPSHDGWLAVLEDYTIHTIHDYRTEEDGVPLGYELWTINDFPYTKYGKSLGTYSVLSVVDPAKLMKTARAVAENRKAYALFPCVRALAAALKGVKP